MVTSINKVFFSPQGSGCGDHIDTRKKKVPHSGVVTSPGFPMGYPNFTHCVWLMEGERDTAFNITVHTLDVTPEYSHCNDYIEVSTMNSWLFCLSIFRIIHPWGQVMGCLILIRSLVVVCYIGRPYIESLGCSYHQLSLSTRSHPHMVQHFIGIFSHLDRSVSPFIMRACCLSVQFAV